MVILSGHVKRIQETCVHNKRLSSLISTTYVRRCFYVPVSKHQFEKTLIITPSRFSRGAGSQASNRADAYPPSGRLQVGSSAFAGFPSSSHPRPSKSTRCGQAGSSPPTAPAIPCHRPEFRANQVAYHEQRHLLFSSFASTTPRTPSNIYRLYLSR